VEFKYEIPDWENKELEEIREDEKNKMLNEAQYLVSLWREEGRDDYTIHTVLISVVLTLIGEIDNPHAKRVVCEATVNRIKDKAAVPFS